MGSHTCAGGADVPGHMHTLASTHSRGTAAGPKYLTEGQSGAWTR